MTFHGKAEINQVLKKHGYGAIESDKIGKSYGSNMPYRTWDGKIVKGISLFRTSPVTFTNAGRENGKKILDNLLDDLMKLGAVKRLSEFGFIATIALNAKKFLSVTGELNSQKGLEYDQTFYYLDITMIELSAKDNLITLMEAQRYKDTPTEQHELTNDYLDYVLTHH